MYKYTIELLYNEEDLFLALKYQSLPLAKLGVIGWRLVSNGLVSDDIMIDIQ